MSFDYQKIIGKIKEKHKRKKSNIKIDIGSNYVDLTDDPSQYVVMPNWWEKLVGIKGIPFGNFVQIAGLTDSGKSSLCLETMKCAQKQYGDDIFIIYVETENKTTSSDLEGWGVDASKVIITGTKIVEDCWGNLYELLEAVQSEYDDPKILLVFDSFAGTVSQHTMDLDSFKDKAKVGGGGVAAINNQHVKRLKGLCQRGMTLAALFVNSVYSNIGSHGKSIKGGETFLHECLITLMAQRTGTVTKTKKGVTYNHAAKIKWRVKKNHAVKGGLTKDGVALPNVVDLEISADGIEIKDMEYEKDEN